MGSRSEENRGSNGTEEQMKKGLGEAFSLAIDTLRRKGTGESLLGVLKYKKSTGFIIGPNDSTSPAIGTEILAGGNLENAKKVEIWIAGGIQGPSRLTLRKKMLKGKKEEITGRVDTWNEVRVSSKELKGHSDNEFKMLNGFADAVSKI